MGKDLLAMTVEHAHRLSGPAYKVLTYMALHGLDKPNSKGQPARLYFAGWVPLARALGYCPDSTDRLPKKAEEAVRKAIAELRRQNLVTPLVDHAHNGSRQSYRIDVAPLLSGATDERLIK